MKASIEGLVCYVYVGLLIKPTHDVHQAAYNDGSESFFVDNSDSLFQPQNARQETVRPSAPSTEPRADKGAESPKTGGG